MSWLRSLFGKESPPRTGLRWSPIKEIRIECECESLSRPQEASDVLLFLSDIQGITGDDLTKIIETAGLSESQGRKAMAFFTPGLHESALSTLRRENLIAVRAAGLPGQPVGELLNDLAVYSGGMLYSAILGFGLATPDPAALMESVKGVQFRPIRQDSDPIMTEAGLVIPRNAWAGISVHGLGRAVHLETGADGTTIVGGAGKASDIIDLCRQIELRWRRSTDPVRRAGLERRLRRLGATIEAPICAESSSLTVKSEGTAIPLGLASGYFATDPFTLECVLENGVYVGFDCAVHDVATVLPALEGAAKKGWPLAVVAPDVSGLALACMVISKLRGVLKCAALRPVGGASFADCILALEGRTAHDGSAVVEGSFRKMVATPDGCLFS